MKITRDDLISILWLFVITIAILGFVFGTLSIKTINEQKTFNRCTNSNVGFWEAMFTELRVEKCEPTTKALKG